MKAFMKGIVIVLMVTYTQQAMLGCMISSALDFIPGVSTVKGITEGLIGVDLITGEELSPASRGLSLLGSIPFANFFSGTVKSTKALKNAKSFAKAAQRASQAGKVKNAIKFASAASRAEKAAMSVSKIGKTIDYAQKIQKAYSATQKMKNCNGTLCSLE